MFDQLLRLYKSAFVIEDAPDRSLSNLYWFSDGSRKWLGIPKEDISHKELALLRAIFPEKDIVSTVSRLNAQEKKWYDFLFANGSLPAEDKVIRAISFQYTGTGTETEYQEFEAALKGFFSDEAVIVLVTERKGIIIEEKKGHVISEEDFISIVNTFESDLFIKTYFYAGKFRLLSEQFAEIFEQEYRFFMKGLKLLPKERVLTFEKVFPILLTEKMDGKLRNTLSQTLLAILEDDRDLLSTVKVFIENNSNASLTAKKLYIHRNTLQYRIEKFIDKTGINLKDFNGALTVYLACLLADVE